jgi:hypothetical protein
MSGGGVMPEEIPLTARERRALAKLEEAIQLVYELPSVSERDFFDKVMPSMVAIQQVVIGTALTRANLGFRGAPA